MSSVALKIDSHDTLAGMVLTEERIFAANIPLEELCVLELPETSYGPLWIRDIKQALDRFPELYEGSRLRMFGNEQSMELWEHPSLGRRKPKLAPKEPENPLEDALIFVRKGGNEFGPYPYGEILHLVADGKFDLTDSFSIDSGKSWDRLHNIQALNRREKLNAERLPKSIAPAALEGHLQAQFFLLKSLEEKPSTLFRGTAESGLLNAAKIAATNVLFPLPRLVISKLTEHFGSPIGQFLDTKTKKMVAISAVSVCALAVLIVAFVRILKTDSASVTDERTQEEQVMQDDSNTNNTPRPHRERRPNSMNNKAEAYKNGRPPVINTSNSSFTKSKAYRQGQQNQSDVSTDTGGDSGYDQQEDPVQQDEIRRKLARETLNPDPPMPGNNPSTAPQVDSEGHDVIEAAQPSESYIQTEE